jgi:hypothetical protein
MARASTVSRLHRIDAGSLSTNVDIPQNEAQAREPAPRAPAAVRGRFRLGRQEPEAGYALDPSMIMGTVVPSMPLDHASRFAVMALRETILRMARARLRGHRGVPVEHLTIQL